MKKILALTVCIALCICFLLTGCAAMPAVNDFVVKEAMTAAAPAEMPAAEVTEEVAVEEAIAYDEEMGYDVSAAPAEGTDIKAEPKLVYTAYLSIQTYNFDEDYAKIKSEVTEAGGYIENENIYSPDANQTYESGRNAYLAIRVPQEKYDAFVNTLDSVAYTQSKSSDVSNISDTYYDTDARIQLLEQRKARLYEQLEEADRMEDKIAIENEISNTIYQLEELQGQKRGMDKSVDYATVNVDLTELVTAGSLSPSFAQFNPGNSFVAGFCNLGSFILMQITWLASSAPTLIVIAVVLAIVFSVLAKKLEGNGKKIVAPFVISILSVVFGAVFSPAGLALGIVSFVKSLKIFKENEAGIAVMILSIIGMVIAIALIAAGAAFGSFNNILF